MSMPKLELISFKLCPFVQRAVITLIHKNIDFDITYIDLNNPPAWFKEVSPLGKVPVLKVGDEVLFESSVIQEYLDEVTPPSSHPEDLLIKAKNRAWIAFGGELMGMTGLHGLVSAKEQDGCDPIISQMRGLLEKIEEVHSGDDFFNGAEMRLIDASYAPLFMRLDLLKRYCGVEMLEGLPKMQRWNEALNNLESVKKSVVTDFNDLYRGMIENYDGYLATKLQKGCCGGCGGK